MSHDSSDSSNPISSILGNLFLILVPVALIVMLGILPYISIQLKAIAVSFSLLRQYPEVSRLAISTQHPIWMDTTFYVALVLIVFTILFGTRHIDNTEIFFRRSFR